MSFRKPSPERLPPERLPRTFAPRTPSPKCHANNEIQIIQSQNDISVLPSRYCHLGIAISVLPSRYCHLKCDPEMPTQKSRSVGGADGGASGAKGRALRGEIASRSAVDWLGRPTNGDYRALRNSGWRKDSNLVDRQMADGYLGRREGADSRRNAGVCETARRRL